MWAFGLRHRRFISFIPPLRTWRKIGIIDMKMLASDQIFLLVAGDGSDVEAL